MPISQNGQNTQTIRLSVFDHFVGLVVKRVKVSITKCKSEILKAQSTTLTLKWSFNAIYNDISRSAICKADLGCILFDQK